jgi:hypothetical protein
MRLGPLCFPALHPPAAACATVSELARRDAPTCDAIHRTPLIRDGKVLTVYGLAASDLGERVTAVASHLGYRVQPDSEPLRNAFIRSDHYSY